MVGDLLNIDGLGNIDGLEVKTGMSRQHDACVEEIELGSKVVSRARKVGRVNIRDIAID